MAGQTGRDMDMRDLRARIVVLETIQNQLLVGVARLSGAPEAFLQGLMQAAAAADAVSSFEDRSMRLIAALTKSGSAH